MFAPSTTAGESVLPQTPSAIPPLENGDSLTREEFERRYGAMPYLKKAELIDGVVPVTAPVRFDCHAEQHAWLICWSTTYVAFTPGVRVGDNASARMNARNEPQPDLALFADAASLSLAQVDDEGYLAASPDLLGEIAASSVSIDLGKKLRNYRAAGVREYIVWRVLDKAVDWFVLRGSDYALLGAGADGIVRSEVFPGLWLDSAAMLKGDLPRVLGVLQLGLQTTEHAAFVVKLRPS
jgi:hypothetical protein